MLHHYGIDLNKAKNQIIVTLHQTIGLLNNKNDMLIIKTNYHILIITEWAFYHCAHITLWYSS